jgi:hypothetical protein
MQRLRSEAHMRQRTAQLTVPSSLYPQTARAFTGFGLGAGGGMRGEATGGEGEDHPGFTLTLFKLWITWLMLSLEADSGFGSLARMAVASAGEMQFCSTRKSTWDCICATMCATNAGGAETAMAVRARSRITLNSHGELGIFAFTKHVHVTCSTVLVRPWADCHDKFTNELMTTTYSKAHTIVGSRLTVLPTPLLSRIHVSNVYNAVRSISNSPYTCHMLGCEYCRVENIWEHGLVCTKRWRLSGGGRRR